MGCGWRGYQAAPDVFARTDYHETDVSSGLAARAGGPGAQVLHAHELTAALLHARIADTAEGGGLDPEARYARVTV
jgi:hypothetical protein